MKLLEAKKVDIDKLKSEKRKILGEFEEQVDDLRREMERKLDADKRELDRDYEQQVSHLEAEERAKYERRVA